MYVQAGTRLDRLQRRLESFEEQLDIIESELEEGKINPNSIRKAKAFKLTLLEEISKLKKEIEKVEEEGLHGGHRSMSKDYFLNDKNKFDYLGIQSDGRKYWRDKNKEHIYSWDGKSREVEVFYNNKNKTHAFTLNENKEPIAGPVRNRLARHVR